MARIVDYEVVLEQMLGERMRSLYHNSGAFGFAKGVAVRHRGWIGADDPALRPAARLMAHYVAEPIESNLAQLAVQVWQEILPGTVWVMPRSHWAYELEFGSAAWMPGLLAEVGVDAEWLASRTDGSAVELDLAEGGGLGRLVQGLLERLTGSDYALGFPGRPVVCTVHHRRQLWWSTSNGELLEGIDSVAERSGLIL